MTEIGSRKGATWVLLVIAVVGFAGAVLGYGYLIASNCGAAGMSEFLSSVRSFHTQAGC